jgi:hypothetical protein
MFRGRGRVDFVFGIFGVDGVGDFVRDRLVTASLGDIFNDVTLRGD